MTIVSPGARFRAALKEEAPLQVMGTINANHALLAKRAGYRAIYLSGGGVAAGSLGLPDLGINTLDDVLVDVRRITDVCDVPLMVDIDTGFGPSAFNIARTVKSLIKAGAAACHIEDQVGAKRCGHRPGKEIVTTDEIRDPHALRIRLRLNGATMQDSSTAQLIFGVDALVAFLSETVTLEPGDVVATGTPAGVGFARTPPVYLKPGDIMEVEVEGLGILSNPVLADGLE